MSSQSFLNADDLQADAEESKQIRKNTLSLQEVRNLCAEMAAADIEMHDLELALIEAKEKFDKYSEEIIPDALMQIGLKGLDLDDGTHIGLSQTVAATITEKNRPAAHAWLRKNGHEDLIKNEVITRFGKGEDEEAKKLMELIKNQGISGKINFGELEQQEKVHASTLKAWVKRRIEDGEKVPADIFGLFLGQKAVVNKK